MKDSQLNRSNNIDIAKEVLDAQNKIRKDLAKYIIKYKYKTHDCQASCYKRHISSNDIFQAENCSKKCSLGLQNCNDTISTLLYAKDREYSLCLIKSNKNNAEEMKCLNKYKQEIANSKKDIEKIYVKNLKYLEDI